MSKILSLGIAILLGALFGTIHPPFNVWYLGIWALPLALWWARLRGHDYLIGWGFGLGYFFVVMHWIYEPFQIEKDAFGWMAVPAWVLMAAGLGLFWLPIFRMRRMGVWFVAIMFVAMEYLRGHIFTGLPWALTAYGFVETPFAESAAFIGSYGLSFILALSALLIAGPVAHPVRAVGVLLLGVISIPTLVDREPTNIEFADFNVTLVQANVTQKESMEYWNAGDFIARNQALSQGDTDLVIWPEGTIAYDVTKEDDMRTEMMAGLSAPLIIGTPYWEGDKYYNAAHVIGQDGAPLFRYEKAHLVPFGEYIPFGEFLRARGFFVDTITRFSMSKGVSREWNVEGLPPINILICYEGIFPRYAQRDGAFIALITNDAWFGNIGGPAQHLASARFRAIEAGKPVARVAKTGITALIDARGRIVEQVPLNTAGSITAPVGAKFETTLYHKLWDYPLYVLIFGTLIFALYKRRLEP